VIVDVGEAVIDAGRNDHDVAGADLARLRRLLERALIARTHGDLHDLAVSGQRLRAFDDAARQQRSRA